MLKCIDKQRSTRNKLRHVHTELYLYSPSKQLLNITIATIAKVMFIVTGQSDAYYTEVNSIKNSARVPSRIRVLGYCFK